MSKRRANGEGSIYKRKSDNRWTGKLQVGFYPNGTPRYKAVYGNSQKEVKGKLEELKGNIKTNNFVEPSKIAFGEWLDSWLNVTVKTSIKNTTWAIYENLVRTHIKPVIGGIKLSKLQTVHIQKLYNEKAKSGRADGKPGGLSAKTLRHMHQVIKNALDQARREGMININVAEAAHLPSVPVKEMKTLTLEQVNSFLSTVKDSKYYKRYYVPFILELYTGLRRGELLGIRWKDIDLDTGRINVIQQVTIENNNAVIRQLKTESSQNRVIVVPSEVTEILKEYKKQKESELFDLGFSAENIKIMTTEGIIFLNELASGPIHPRRFLRGFKCALKEAKLPEIRFHDMRHTFVLLSLQQGVDIKTIQSDLGHNDISTTLDRYGHVNDMMKQDAANKRSMLFKNVINTNNE